MRRPDPRDLPELVPAWVARMIEVGEDGCWRWLGPVNGKGRIPWSTTRGESVARIVWRWAHRGHLHGWIVVPACRHRACVRPSHLVRTDWCGLYAAARQPDGRRRYYLDP